MRYYFSPSERQAVEVADNGTVSDPETNEVFDDLSLEFLADSSDWLEYYSREDAIRAGSLEFYSSDVIATMKTALEHFYYFCGQRDPKRNPDFPGEFMVATPETDGNSSYCIVGDNLDELIIEAYNVILNDEYPL